MEFIYSQVTGNLNQVNVFIIILFCLYLINMIVYIEIRILEGPR